LKSVVFIILLWFDSRGKNWVAYPCRGLAGGPSSASSGACRDRFPEGDRQRCRPRADREGSWWKLEKNPAKFSQRNGALPQIRRSLRPADDRASKLSGVGKGI